MNRTYELNDMLDVATAKRLLGEKTEWGTCDQLWVIGLRAKLPFRSEAVIAGIELPEPTIELWREAMAWHGRCFYCNGREFLSDLFQTHHIERRPHCHPPHRDWGENLFLGHRSCHEGPLATLPHAEQLAKKWKHDHCGWRTLEEFLARWLRVGDGETIKAPSRVTVEEIESHL